MSTRAVTYCRISYDPTGQEAGVERQRIDTDRLAAERGWSVTERVVDNDRSASRYAKRTREGWARLMKAIEAREIDALVAYDLDRLTRQPKELERLIDAADNGLSVVTAAGMIDLATAGGRMVARTLCNVAAHEADRVRDRMKAKLRHDAENGRPHWVRRPFGYTMDAQVVADEAQWVRAMAAWIIDGDSATVVAAKLNEAQVQQGSGKRWQSAGVKFLLTSPRIVGKRTYHGNIVGPGAWEPLLDEATWNRVCAVLRLRSQGMNSGRRSMLTGMVRCGVCGEHMTRTNASDKAQWRCTKRPDLALGCGQSFSAKHLDRLVVDMVLVRLGDVTPRRTVALGNDPGETEALRTDLEELAEMLGTGALSMAEWKAARAPLQARLDAAEQLSARSDASTALGRLTGDTATLADRWGDLDVDLRRRLIALVLDHVTVAAGRRGKLDLDRIRPVWKA